MGRPRKDPRGTQKELREQAAQKRRAERHADEDRTREVAEQVQAALIEVFREVPWFPRVIGQLFIQSTRRVAEKNLHFPKERLSALVTVEFTKILNECASFDGLSRISSLGSPDRPIDMLGVLQVAATPTVMAGSVVPMLPDEFLDDSDDLPPVSDEEAAAHGWLPE